MDEAAGSLGIENLLERKPKELSGGQLTDRAGAAGHVFVAELLGADVLVTVELGEELVKARVPAPYDGHVNAGVSVVFAPDKVHLFDPSDGRAVLAARSAAIPIRQESA